MSQKVVLEQFEVREYYSVHETSLKESLNEYRRKGYKVLTIHFFHPTYRENEAIYDRDGNYKTSIDKWVPQDRPNAIVVYEREISDG